MYSTCQTLATTFRALYNWYYMYGFNAERS